MQLITRFIAWVTGLVQYLIWVNLSAEFITHYILDDKMPARKRDSHDGFNYTATPVLLDKVVNEVVTYCHTWESYIASYFIVQCIILHWCSWTVVFCMRWTPQTSQSLNCERITWILCSESIISVLCLTMQLLDFFLLLSLFEDLCWIHFHHCWLWFLALVMSIYSADKTLHMVQISAGGDGSIFGFCQQPRWPVTSGGSWSIR